MFSRTAYWQDNGNPQAETKTSPCQYMCYVDLGLAHVPIIFVSQGARFNSIYVL
jgi:hypothetical protein